MMTGDDFRRLALALEGVEERAHMGHPDFRVHGKIFASLRSHDTLGMVKLTPDEQRELLRENPDTFVPSSGAWGRQGCTDVRLSSAERATVRGALILAWQTTIAKAESPRRRQPRKPPRAKPSRKR